MVDAVSVILAVVLQNLSDKLYEKCKNAVLEGGLIGLAAATVGLTSEAAKHSEDIVTESDQFSIEKFIPLLRERLNVLNPYARQFLIGWITILDSVPDIDMLGFLPDFLDDNELVPVYSS